MKKYRREELTIPERIFNKLINISPRKEYWLSKVKKLEDNWGEVKGEKTYANGPNMIKTIEHARKFRKTIKVNIKLTPFFCEFYGLLLGDGCITKFKDYEEKERYAIEGFEKPFCEI